ncbi:uncharacterized protein [Amphiura filiformis]|uniref:uncharacterized protein n=1 Tax=Amphiura filiformis TaxID=82378 RepID=UPI003B20D45B
MKVILNEAAAPYLMLSYQWDSKQRVRKLYRKLQAAKYEVWIDFERMEGGLVGSMANAVGNADTVLICVTAKYQESENCKSEAVNAYHLKKRIIPLIFESTFKLGDTDWLSFIVRPRLYFRFDTDELLEENFPDLLRALGDSGRDISAMCLTGVAPRGTRAIACPLCRQQAVVPGRDATKFPTNFLLRELIEEESKREQLFQKDSGFTCTCCDNKSQVEGKCETCNQYLCEDGVNAHKRDDALRDHKVIVFDAEDIEHVEPKSETKACTPTSKPELELIMTTDWGIFDALYDEEHSIHLFGYWMNQMAPRKTSRRSLWPAKLRKRKRTWCESMVSHYMTCLQEGVLSEEEVVPRSIKVAYVFKQAGQYKEALQLLEKILHDEKERNRAEPETLANLYYLGAEIYRECMYQSVDR